MTDRTNWFKVKVTQKGDGYKVEYGNVNATTPSIKEVSKTADKTFICLSLRDGKEVILPEEWNIMWSSAMSYNQMPNEKIIYGPASDVITVNRYDGVESAVAIIDEVYSFDKFNKKYLNQVNFHIEADLIGTNWRTAPMPGFTPGPKFERFYVTKDKEGNCYKFAFMSFCKEDGGDRGLPELIFSTVE